MRADAGGYDEPGRVAHSESFQSIDGDGVELIRKDSTSIYFNLDTDSAKERTAWVKGDDGFLVRDLNANGKIDGISEMFGSASESGFTVLKALDSNNDNKITSADTAFSTLRVWKDLNGNGVTDAGELFTLAALGITSIDAVGTAQTGKWNTGSQIRAEATFVASGVTRTIADVLLETSQTDTQYGGTTVITTAAAANPALKGYGTLVDLRIRMSEDTVATVGLLAKVTAFKALSPTSNWATQRMAVLAATAVMMCISSPIVAQSNSRPPIAEPTAPARIATCAFRVKPYPCGNFKAGGRICAPEQILRLSPDHASDVIKLQLAVA